MSDGSEGTRDEAEQKLEQHLDEARPKVDGAAEPTSSGTKKADAGDVATIQEDEQLTPADRVDRIANQAMPDHNDSEIRHPDSKP